MAILDVVKFPDERLRQPTVLVEASTADIRQLVADLTDTMYALEGAGIAAIQVGRPERIFLIDGRVAGGDEHAPPVVCINPEIVETGRGLSISDEGCLSFPDVFVEVKRPRWAKLKAVDIEFRPFEIEGEGLLGRALQHEFDHLEGRLLVDMVGMVKKEMIRRKMKRWHGSHSAEVASSPSP